MTTEKNHDKLVRGASGILSSHGKDNDVVVIACNPVWIRGPEERHKVFLRNVDLYFCVHAQDGPRVEI